MQHGSWRLLSPGSIFFAAEDRLSPGIDKIRLCNCMVQTVLNKQMGTGKELRTIQDLQSFEGIASVLGKARESGTVDVTRRQLGITQQFFLELANTLPSEQPDDETRVTIAMEESLLRELKRVAQVEGIPVHKLVADIILGHLNGSKASATAGERR
jgi:predicted DNA binding CopG/RHH family protein